VAGDGGPGAGGAHPDLQPQRRQDVALLSIRVMDAGDSGGAVTEAFRTAADVRCAIDPTRLLRV
jgi:hypothetical protein